MQNEKEQVISGSKHSMWEEKNLMCFRVCKVSEVGTPQPEGVSCSMSVGARHCRAL